MRSCGPPRSSHTSARSSRQRKAGGQTSRGWPRCERTTSNKGPDDSMCTLICLWRSVSGFDIVVGMNRDESMTRPSDPPAVLPGTPLIVAPRDRQAGGTWIGASGTGLVVALSNRRGRAASSARSRGQLVLDGLRQPSVAAVDVFLQRTVREHEYNFWNLFAASRTELGFFRYDGEVSMSRGQPGVNVLTNEGGNVESDPKVQLVQGLLARVP